MKQLTCVFALAGLGLLAIACSEHPAAPTSAGQVGAAASATARLSASGDDARQPHIQADCETLAARLRQAVRNGRLTPAAAREIYSARCSPEPARRPSRGR
jgi:hypothetical protein